MVAEEIIKAVLVVKTILFSGCGSNNNCDSYLMSEVKIKDVYQSDEDKTLYISYSTMLETVYYSPGVIVSKSEKGDDYISVSFIRSHIHADANITDYKSVYGGDFPSNIIHKDSLEFTETDCIVAIRIGELVTKDICDNYFDIPIKK